jgi:hypothetical protein
MSSLHAQLHDEPTRAVDSTTRRARFSNLTFGFYEAKPILDVSGAGDNIGAFHRHINRCVDDQHATGVADARQTSEHDDGQRTPRHCRSWLHRLVYARVPTALLGVAEQTGKQRMAPTFNAE